MHESFGDRMFYHPSSEAYGHPDEFGLAFESVRFEGGAGRLHGWFFPAEGEPRGTVVHCHGNGGNITGHFKYITGMPARGWNVLCFDYRGFGESEGSPDRKGTIADTRAAIDYARARSGANGVALFGQSLGGAVGIVAAAADGGLAAVAVEGAFSDYRLAARFFCKQSILLWGMAPFVGRFFVSDGLDPIDHVARVAPTPMFFITGSADTVCDHRQTLNLHAAAGEPKSLWVIDGGGHTGALDETDGEGVRRLDEFFGRHVGRC